MNTDKIIRALLKEFKNLEDTDTSSWENDQWTKAVLTVLCYVGRRFDFTTWASKVDGQFKNGGEWLYDVTWLEYEGDFLKSVPLAAECEWGNLGDIKDDFEKLMQARAAVRVFVFDGRYCENGAEALANKFCDWVGAFEGRQKGDNYLLVGYEEDEEDWCFRYFSITVNASNQQPTLKRL